MDDEYITPEKYGASGYNNSKVVLCSVCGFIFETTQMRKYKGKYYCKPNGCYKDIKGLMSGRHGNKSTVKGIPAPEFTWLLTTDNKGLVTTNDDALALY